MALIKSTNSDRIARSAMVLDLQDLTNEGDRIIADARVEAERIVADGLRDAQSVIAEARETAQREGYERGHSEGREVGEREAREAVLAETRQVIDGLAERWSSALDEWSSRREAMLRDARRDVLELAVEIARRVTHRAIEVQPEIIADQLIDALRLITRPTTVEVLIHPEDRPVLQELLPGVLDRAQRVTDAVLRDDDTLERGGCIVRTAGGEVDATIGTQLDRLAAALLPPRETNAS